MHPRRKAREYAVAVLFLWDANGEPDSEAADRLLRSGTLLEGVTGGPAVETAPKLVQVGVSDVAELATAAGGWEAVARSEAMDMARGAWLDREEIDRRMAFHAPQWPPKRQPAVDRAILRLAVWELTHSEISPKIVLDEAIEMARLFSTENSPAFVNGVLDAIHRENQALMSTTGTPVPKEK